MKKILLLSLLLPTLVFAQPSGQRPLSSSTDSVAAVQSGTWTVQPGNIANTTAWKVDGSAVIQPVSGSLTCDVSDLFALDASVDQVEGYLDLVETKLDSIISGQLPSNHQVTCNAGTNLNTSLLSTAAKQPALGTAGTASTDVITVQGIAAMTALKVDGSAVTQPVSGTITANLGTIADVATATLQGTGNTSLGNIDTDATTIIGHVDGIEGLIGTTNTTLGTIDTDTGNIDTSLNNIEASVAAEGAALGSGVLLQGDDGTDRKNVNVDATTGDLQVDVTNSVTVTDGAGALNTIIDSGTVTVSDGAGALNVIIDSGTTAVTATNLDVQIGGSDSLTIGTFPDNEPINIAQMNGVAVTMGNGASGTGVQRVTLANDSTGIVGLEPKATGGLTTYHLVSAATTNATNIKASAGVVYGWFIYNSNAAARKVAFHNTAGTPTAGASVYYSLVIPPSSGANVEFANGLAFSTGIGISTTTGLADSDSAAVAANDLIINIWYK